MKKLVIIGIGIVVGFFSVQSMVAQVVEVRPLVTKTIGYQPTIRKGHVWVKGHWKWEARKRTHIWTQGNYVKARPGRIWIDGQWVRVRGGWEWKSGYWKRF